MPSEKTNRAARIIARYQAEMKINDDRNVYAYMDAPRSYNNRKLRQNYCFPMLFSALFYDPTPEQICYIAEQADHLLWPKLPFFAEKLMQLASAETGNADAVADWQAAIPEHSHYDILRPILVFGSAHPNGYVREKCVEQFTGKKMLQTVGYTLMRLNDWVPEIRRTALRTLGLQMQQPHTADDLLASMHCIEKLRRSERAYREPEFSMEKLDLFLMQYLEADPRRRWNAKGNIRFCYKLFALHPEPQYRGLILHFYQEECSGELRCMLERIYLQMSVGSVPAKALELFMQDSYEHVRLIAYDYRIKHEGIWDGFEKLLLSPSRRIRIFAKNQLRSAGTDCLQFCRDHLPDALPALGDFGTAEDIPRIRPYLESHPCEAMYALVKLGAEDGKALLLKNMQSKDAKLAKAAYHLALSQKCLEAADLLPVMQSTADPILQYRIAMLLTKDGIWPAIPYLLRFTCDYPKLRSDLYYMIWKRTREKGYVTEELSQEISSALAYARERNAIPFELNNHICIQQRRR